MTGPRTTPSSFRIDVRENLEGAARAERFYNGNSIILISDELADEWMKGGWSWPLQVSAVRDGENSPILVLTLREIAE
jgi:hypothetical protein